MRTRLVLPVLLLLGLVGLAACGSDDKTSASSGGATTAPTTAPAGGLAGTAWDLSSYQGPGGIAVPAVPHANATLAFDSKGSVAGSTGCNQFSGTFTTDGQSLSIKVGPMTQMACISPLLTAQETAVVNLLGQVTGFTASADKLSLTGAAGAEQLSYAAGLQSLDDTSWKATGVNNGKGGVESNALTENLTAVFGADGVFSGFGGCNTMSGMYQSTGTDGLTISGLISTKKSCSTDVDQLESQYVAALGQVSTYTISGEVLTLRNSNGATQATYTLGS